MNTYELIVKKLTEQNKTIATMESATGGAVANAITNVDGASKVISFSAVTYSNKFKIKMGVDARVINKYTVYSFETAKEMSKNIAKFANSNFGVGVTGKMRRVDEANPYGDDSTIYVSIYNADTDEYFLDSVKATKDTREENKVLVVEKVKEMLLNIL